MTFRRNQRSSLENSKPSLRCYRWTPRLELLEDRTVPSGSSFNIPIGTLPSGKNLTVRFDATVDSPATKGINLIYNQGSVSGSNFATVKTDDPSQGGTTDPTRITVNLAPMVTNIFFRSSAWNGTFLSNLQTQGAGDSTFGYAIPTGANQTANMPWYNIDRVSIRFSEDVNVAADDLQLFGVSTANYGLTGFTYDNTTFTATWTITGGINNDLLRVVLDGGASGVTELTGGNRLDGEWIDNTAAFPSGNGTGGGDFSMRVNVLAADTNQDGVVNTTDTVLIRNAIGGNNVYRDVNGDGAVNTTDFVQARASVGSVPPPGTPSGTPGSGWVANNTPTPPNPPGGPANTVSATKTVILLTDLNGNGLVDAGDTLRYTIVISNTGGSSATGMQLDDTLDSHTALVPGSLDASPLAVNDSYNGPAGSDLIISNPAQGLFANDSEYLGDTFSLQSYTQPSIPGSSVTVNNDGTFTFHPGASGADSFTYTIVDSQGLTSTATVSVVIANSNVAPVLSNIEGTALAYTENQVATAITATLTVTDSDSPNLVGATVSITAGFANGQDVLAFTNQNGITGSYNSSTGVLTLTGSSSFANYQTALRSITYSNSSENPSTTTRTISFQVDDGGATNNLSNTVIRNITITAVNDAPVLAGIEGTALAYTENQAATAITTTLTISDVDSANLTGATVSITTGFTSGQDVLVFTNQNGISGSYNSGTGVLTLTGSSSVANYQTALRSITYFNSSDNPSTTTRTISFQVDDGQAVNHASNTVTRNISITAVNDSPVLAAIEGAALGYTENQAATAITATLTVSDIDSTNLTGATVSITVGFTSGQDVLAFTNQNGISGSYNSGTGVLTLTGSSSVANYQTALRSITYFNSSDNPSTTTRTISFQVDDGQAVNHASNTVTRDITITAVNDAPVLAAIEGAALGYTENQAATAITATLTVSDVDSTNLTGATISITAGFASGQDVLAFTNQNGISGSYNSGTGVLTLTGSSSVANYQTALRSITYFNSSDNPSTTTRTISFQVDDGQAVNHASNTVTRNITITAVNDAPVLAGIEGTALAYNQNASAAAITNAITASDVDSANFTGAMITISAGYVNGQDTLTFTNQNGITGSFVAATGVLTLSGSSSVANYQTALRSVGFSNSQGTTNTVSRTISFQVNDGGAVNNLSNTVTRNITINRAPTGVADSYNAVGNTQLLVGVTQGSNPAAVTSGTVLGNDSDPESNNPIAIGTVNTSGTAGAVSMNSDGTFTFTPNVGFTGATTFTYTVVDSLGAVSNPVTVTITVATKVWYIDSTAGATGDGRSNNPFDSLADLTGASGPDATGDIIYLREQAGDYNGNMTLLANQQLIGSGVNLVVGGFTLLASTSNTTWTTTVAATDAITLSTGNTIRGFTIGNTTGTHIIGTAVGSLSIDTVTLNGSGAAFNVSTSGALAVTIDSLTSTSSTTAVNLVGTTGSFSANSGAISGASGTDFNVSGGSSNITYAGTITNTAGSSVVVASHTGGTVAFSGAISDTGSGISLTNNTGATINFTGGLSLSTGANAGLTATGGGTVSATQNNTTIVNTITTTTGTALNVVNTTIGASNLTFRSISSNGAANGVILNNTGTSGGLSIVGTGAANSGGTIQNATDGLLLTTTRNVSLTSLNIQNTSRFGISGIGVVNFSFINGTINNSGTSLTAQDSNIGFAGRDGNFVSGVSYISGTLTVTGSTLTNAFYHGITVRQDAGSISNLNISNNTFTSSAVAANSNGSAVDIDPTGSLTTHADVVMGTISNNVITNFPSGAGIQVLGGNSTAGASGQQVLIGTAGSATNKLTISGNAISGASVAVPLGTNAIAVQTNGFAQSNIDIINNGTAAVRLKNFAGNGIVYGATGETIATGLINNNFIDAAANIFASPGISVGADNTFGTSDTPDFRLVISNNTVSNSDGNGILATARSATSTVAYKIVNNVIGAPRSGVRPGIRVDAGNASSIDDAVYLEISGNTSAGSGGTQGIGLRKQGTVTTTNDFAVKGMSATATPNVESYINSQNPLGGGTLLISATSGFSNWTGGGGQPPLFPMLAAAGGIESANPLPKATNLRPSDLKPIVAEAIRRWSTVGLSAKELASLRSVSVQIADLPGQYLGTAPLFGKTITLDSNAAGYGWYIDRSPRDDAEFGIKGTGMKRFTTPTQAPAGRMDLLTVVMHEFSHILGMESSYSPADSDSIVSAYLTAGTRILPGVRAIADTTVKTVSRSDSSLIADLLFISKTTSRRTGSVGTIA